MVVLMQELIDYTTKTTETLGSLLELTTSVSDTNNVTRETLLRLIETLVNNHMISKSEDLQYIFNRKENDNDKSSNES
jgi:hypothetical protein